MPRSLPRFLAFAAAFAALPAGGMALYSERAASSLRAYHAQAWEDAGMSMSHQSSRVAHFSFRLLLGGVAARGTSGEAATVEEVSIPLLPGMATVAKGVRLRQADGLEARIAAVELSVRRGVLSDIRARDVSLSGPRFAGEAASLDVRRLTSDHLNGLEMTEIVLETPAGRATAARVSVAEADLAAPATPASLRRAEAFQVRLDARPARNAPLLRAGGDNTLRAERVRWGVEGERGRESGAFAEFEDARFRLGPGMDGRVRLRRSEEGRRLSWDLDGENVPHLSGEAAWASPPASALFDTPASGWRASMNLSDASGTLREYARRLSGLNGGREGDEAFLANALLERGMAGRESATALASWLRQPGRTVTIRMESAADSPLRVSARLRP